MLGVNQKCARCNKTVYHAEQKLAENKVWHNLCWSLEFKDRENKKKAMKEEISYTKPADVRPEYYRVADIDSGVPARMESSVQEAPAPEKSAPVNAAPAPVSNVNPATPKFCVECGASRGPNDRFCAGCGAKLN